MKKKLKIILILYLLPIFTLIISYQIALGENLTAEAWYKKGLTFNESGRYEDAINAFDKAIRLKPDDAETWNDKGIALAKLKRYKEALYAFDEAIQLGHNYGKGWHNKGLTLCELKRYKEALYAFDKAIQLNPNDAVYWYGKGWVLDESKEYEEAIKSYDEALRLKPNYADAWYNKGRALGKSGRYEEAIRLKPDYTLAKNSKKALLARLNKDIDKAPSIYIIKTPDRIDSINATVTLEIIDNGGGIGDVKVYVNDNLISSDTRRIAPVKPDGKSVYKSYDITLSPGENVIKALAFNKSNTITSPEASHVIYASIAETAHSESSSKNKPDLYVLSIGVSSYKHEALSLKYAAKDARDFADLFRKQKGGLYEKVYVKTLTDENVTREDIIKTMMNFLGKASYEDVVIVYLAGHGTRSTDGKYYYLTYDTNPAEFEIRALTMADFESQIQKVKEHVGKVIIFTDTCKSGSMQIASLRSTPVAQDVIGIIKGIGITIPSCIKSLG